MDSFAGSELARVNIMSSQQVGQPMALDRVKSGLSNSFTLNEELFVNQVKTIKLVKNSMEVKASQKEEEGIRHTKKKFALNSTSSTLGNFSEKWRTTIGRKKLHERAESPE